MFKNLRIEELLLLSALLYVFYLTIKKCYSKKKTENFGRHDGNHDSIKNDIKNKTLEFATLVTNVNRDSLKNEERASKVAKLFSKDAVLRGTVSQVMRTHESKPNIEQYFLYFNKNNKPYLEVLNSDFNIQKLSDGVWINYANVLFKSSERGDTLTALMTFIFKQNRKSGEWEIQTLHSSPIVNPNPPLLVKQGDTFKHWALNNPYTI